MPEEQLNNQQNDMAQAMDDLADSYEKALGVKVIGIELVDPTTVAIMLERDGKQGYFVTSIENPKVPSEIFQDQQGQQGEQQAQQTSQRRKPGTPIGGSQGK